MSNQGQIIRTIKAMVEKEEAILKASSVEVIEAAESLALFIQDINESGINIRDLLGSRLYGRFINYFKKLHEESLVRKSREDPNDFMEYVFADDTSGEPVQQGDMHREWQGLMGRVKQSLIIGPRGHGKSTQVSIGRGLYELGRDPDKRIKIISNTDSEAAKRVSAMQRHIQENPRLHKVFPHLRPADQSRWTSQRFYVKRRSLALDPSVEGYGVFSSGTGGRADIIIFDDVVDRKNALTQPSLREQVKEAVLSDWLALLSDKGWCVYICTLWHKKDLSHEIGGDVLKVFLRGGKPDQSNLEDGAWHVSFNAVGPEFEPVWPEKWPKEKLIEKYNQVGRKSFNRGWRNRATDDSETIISPEWIKFYSPNEIPSLEELILIISYDLALATKPSDKNSFFACTVGAVDLRAFQDPKVYIIDAFKKQCRFTQQINIIKEGHRRVKPMVILAEAVYYQAALSQFLIDTTTLPIVPIKPAVSKKLRLEASSPMFEGGHVLFNPKLDPSRNRYVEARGDIISEIKEFPFSEHDDLVDSTTQLLQYVQRHAEDLRRSQVGTFRKSSGRAFTISA